MAVKHCLGADLFGRRCLRRFDLMWCPLHPFASRAETCRACQKPLFPENIRIADGCPCNSGRGINHGLVPKDTCTCVECDPAQTGSTRYPEASALPTTKETP